MKKIILFAFLLVLGRTALAQSDSLQVYTGKFKFPDGTPFAVVTITLDSNTHVLTAATSMGSSSLKWSSADVFEVVDYGGMATFRRNEQGKIVGVRVQVSSIDAEGTKEEDN